MSPLDSKAQAGVGQALNSFAAAAQRELETVSLAFKERGANRFARMIGIGLGAVILSYVAIYAPANQKAGGLARRLAAARATAQYADRYKSLRQRLDHINSLLGAGQADGWVLDRVRQTLNERKLVSDAIGSPESRALEGFSEQTVRFSITAKFPDLVSWLDDLEYGSGIVHVTSLQIERQAGKSEIGVNRVECAVVAPSARSRP